MKKKIKLLVFLTLIVIVGYTKGKQVDETAKTKQLPDTQIIINKTQNNKVVLEKKDAHENDTVSTNSSKTEDKSSTQTTNKEETHTHKWTEHTKTIQHKEEGHYETQVVKEAYNEEVYAWRTFCNKCGEDITDLGAEGITVHSAIHCESGYHNDYVVVQTIPHEAVTKQVWIVDKEGYTEIITICKCECGVVRNSE